MGNYWQGKGEIKFLSFPFTFHWRAHGCQLASLWHLYGYLVRLISYSPPRTVFKIESATISASPAPAIAACDPPLKAKKPKNRMNPPKAACCVKQQTINEHLRGFPLPEQLVGKIAFIVFQKLHTTPFIGGQKCHTPCTSSSFIPTPYKAAII